VELLSELLQAIVEECRKIVEMDRESDIVARGVTRLDGARGKKQVWHPHVRT